MSELIANPLRYRGHSTPYVDIAVRGEDFLGIGLQYAVHPSKVGCFVVRFVSHGPKGKHIDPASFTHLTLREKAQFVIPIKGEFHGTVIEGVRLNKVAVPMFDPPVRPTEIDKFATKFGVWSLLTEWVAEQAVAEGFTINVVDLEGAIRSLMVPPGTPEDAVTCVVTFPDLNTPEQKNAGKKAKFLAPEPEDEDEPEDDSDDDDDDDDKGWLN